MIETQVDPDRRIAIHRGHGTLLIDELPAVTRRLAADPAFDPDLLYREHNWSAEWRTFSTMNAAVVWCMHGRSA